MKRIACNGRTFSRTQIKNNIMKVWNASSTDTVWYQDTHDFACELAQATATPLCQACGIIAAISPRMPWYRNKELAKQVIFGICPPHDLPVMKYVKKKVGMILDYGQSEEDIRVILNGPKTTAFFMNMLHPELSDHVTIDRHALSIAFGERITDADLNLTCNQYQFIEDCYKWTAEKLNILPTLLQSITWETWRKQK